MTDFTYEDAALRIVHAYNILDDGRSKAEIGAKLSKTYKSGENEESALKKLFKGLKKNASDNKGGRNTAPPLVVAYLYSDGVLAIPGSRGAKHYTKFNFKLFPRKKIIHGKSYKVHGGFKKHSDIILNLLEADPKNKAKIKAIVGHSLGGASAQLLASHFPNAKIITLASPRVIKKRKYPSAPNVANLIRDDDAIAHLPSFRYTHLGGVDKVGMQAFNTPTDKREDPHEPNAYVKMLGDPKRLKKYAFLKRKFALA